MILISKSPSLIAYENPDVWNWSGKGVLNAEFTKANYQLWKICGYLFFIGHSLRTQSKWKEQHKQRLVKSRNLHATKEPIELKRTINIWGWTVRPYGSSSSVFCHYCGSLCTHSFFVSRRALKSCDQNRHNGHTPKNLHANRRHTHHIERTSVFDYGAICAWFVLVCFRLSRLKQFLLINL